MARDSFEHGMFVSGPCKTAGPEKGGLQMKEECILVADRLEPRYIAEDEISRDGGQWPEYCRTLVVCVDSFENGLAEGWLHSFCLPAPRPFHSLDQLLFSMEEVLNESKLAEPWNITRTLNGRRARKRKRDPFRRCPTALLQSLPGISMLCGQGEENWRVFICGCIPDRMLPCKAY